MTKKFTIILSAVIALTCCIGLVSFSPLAFSDDAPSHTKNGITTTDYNDWHVACGKSAKDAKKTACEMFQLMTFKDGKNLALGTYVNNKEIKGKEMTMIRLLTPLGTLLPSGVAIKIDDDKQRNLPYTQCVPKGCAVNMIFEDKMVDKLKAGKKMLVAYKNVQNKTITIEVSLMGFSQALNALQETGK